MKAFLDTSSLIKLYHKEEGSDYVMNALSNDIREIFLTTDKLLQTFLKKEQLQVM